MKKAIVRIVPVFAYRVAVPAKDVDELAGSSNLTTLPRFL